MDSRHLLHPESSSHSGGGIANPDAHFAHLDSLPTNSSNPDFANPGRDQHASRQSPDANEPASQAHSSGSQPASSGRQLYASGNELPSGGSFVGQPSSHLAQQMSSSGGQHAEQLQAQQAQHEQEMDDLRQQHAAQLAAVQAQAVTKMKELIEKVSSSCLPWQGTFWEAVAVV